LAPSSEGLVGKEKEEKAKVDLYLHIAHPPRPLHRNRLRRRDPSAKRRVSSVERRTIK
jgi:hypothetical protein